MQTTCLNCGNSLSGDGHTIALHCESTELPLDREPDAKPLYCNWPYEGEDKLIRERSADTENRVSGTPNDLFGD